MPIRGPVKVEQAGVPFEQTGVEDREDSAHDSLPGQRRKRRGGSGFATTFLDRGDHRFERPQSALVHLAARPKCLEQAQTAHRRLVFQEFEHRDQGRPDADAPLRAGLVGFAHILACPRDRLVERGQKAIFEVLEDFVEGAARNAGA